MRCVSGTFKLPASDIDIHFGIGFMPDRVKVYALPSDEEVAFWSINMMRRATVLGGVTINDDGDVTPVATIDTGIQLDRGFHTVTSTEASNGNYLTWDDLDYSKQANAGSAYEDITKWTYYDGYTGHWDQPCNTTYVGVGSFIWIDGKRYMINALTSDGDATNNVTINETGIHSGAITRISSMYDMKILTANKISKPGFWLDSTSQIFTATSELAFFEAWKYDR